jgi:hydrogenase nickel incorporation protein HypB
MKIKVVREILEANDQVANGIKETLAASNTWMINVMGSPGSGKTCLIERTIEEIGGSCRIGVIEGDIRTSLDSQRLSRFDIPVVQINTEPFGGDCHLPATAVGSALEDLDLGSLDLVIVENVGNLVCPAEFYIGEHRKVVVLSLTEGADKPLKYPLMFKESNTVVISKLDLLPHLDINLAEVRGNALSVNPSLEVFELSARTGEGLDGWLAWIRGECESVSRSA